MLCKEPETMINNVNFSLLVGEELYKLGKRSIEITSEIKLVHDVVNPIATELISKCSHSFDGFDEAFIKQQASIVTQEIAECDSRFDDAFVAWRHFLQACALLPNEESRKAAELLLMKIKNHGWGIQNMSYTKQLANGADLKSEIRNNPEALAAITSLGSETWFERVEKTHDAFAAAIAKRDAQNAETAHVDPATARRNLRADLRNLYDYLSVMGKVQPKEYNSVIAQLNVVIDDIMSQAKARRTRNKNANIEVED